jgi:L-lactate dehydrogenase complex protein LldG
MSQISHAQDTRAAMLGRIRRALQDVPSDEPVLPVPIPRTYRQTGPFLETDALMARFLEHLADYHVTVHQVPASDLQATINALCSQRGIRRLAVPADLPASWLPAQVELLHDDPPLSYAQLDESDGVLTGCTLGIAQTGTIVLDGGVAQGRRVLTLLPDYHLCVIFADQIVDLVPEALARLATPASEQPRPLTFVSGPSATSDIELSRVEGVHGPRMLEVLVCQR